MTIIVSCKNNNDTNKQSSKIDTIKVNQNPETNELEVHDNALPTVTNCLESLTSLIKSSNLKNAFKEELKVEIESQNSLNIKLRLFVEDSNNTVGLIIFDGEHKKLLDITNDIENPEELKFEVEKWNNIIDCSFKNNNSYYIKKEKFQDKKSCKTTSIDMESTEECIFESNTLQNVYDELLKSKEISEAEYFIKPIPKYDQSVKVNKNGLITIDYKIKVNKIEMILNYEGGVTTIIIEQLKDKVKRTIITSAD